jgi:glutamate/tyrosine decarboxylase-like PLP-dependent enzyme
VTGTLRRGTASEDQPAIEEPTVDLRPGIAHRRASDPDPRWGPETAALLRRTADLALDYLETLPDRHVAPTATLDELRARLGGELNAEPEDPVAVIEAMGRESDGGVMASAGPRFFGFVIGGSLPAALAADWLATAWDQNAGLFATGPAAAVAEETAARWLLELFGLPGSASVGFTTGCQMSHVVCLAAARRGVLLAAGWDVDSDGLAGAPPVTVIVGGEVHVTVPIALQILGLGSQRVVRTAVDGQGRMDPSSLREILSTVEGPTIVCAQSGNVNTGAFDPLDAIADAISGRPATWLHVDGAFGLWAAVVPGMRHLLNGAERADSWSTDAHKWLNVPYDSGIAIVRDPQLHRAAVMLSAAYLIQSHGETRDNSDWVTEFSRRARGWPVYAALRSLGSEGVTALVERCCRLARRMAAGLAVADGVIILNDVVLNQVLVRFGDDDGLTRDVVRRLQEDGTAWTSGSTWHGMAVMRLSVSNWSTTDRDIDLTVDAILRCWEAAGADHRNGTETAR